MASSKCNTVVEKKVYYGLLVQKSILCIAAHLNPIIVLIAIFFYKYASKLSWNNMSLWYASGTRILVSINETEQQM